MTGTRFGNKKKDGGVALKTNKSLKQTVAAPKLDDKIGDKQESSGSLATFMKGKLEEKPKPPARRDIMLRLPEDKVDQIDNLRGKTSRNEFYEALTDYVLDHKEMFTF